MGNTSFEAQRASEIFCNHFLLLFHDFGYAQEQVYILRIYWVEATFSSHSFRMFYS